MAELTREQVEGIAASVRSAAFQDTPCATIKPYELRALCDLALRALSEREGWKMVPVEQSNANPNDAMGKCCYGGIRRRLACASCSGWTPIAAPALPVERGEG